MSSASAAASAEERSSSSSSPSDNEEQEQEQEQEQEKPVAGKVEREPPQPGSTTHDIAKLSRRYRAWLKDPVSKKAGWAPELFVPDSKSEEQRQIREYQERLAGKPVTVGPYDTAFYVFSGTPTRKLKAVGTASKAALGKRIADARAYQPPSAEELKKMSRQQRSNQSKLRHEKELLDTAGTSTTDIRGHRKLVRNGMRRVVNEITTMNVVAESPSILLTAARSNDAIVAVPTGNSATQMLMSSLTELMAFVNEFNKITEGAVIERLQQLKKRNSGSKEDYTMKDPMDAARLPLGELLCTIMEMSFLRTKSATHGYNGAQLFHGGPLVGTNTGAKHVFGKKVERKKKEQTEQKEPKKPAGVADLEKEEEEEEEEEEEDEEEEEEEEEKVSRKKPSAANGNSKKRKSRVVPQDEEEEEEEEEEEAEDLPQPSPSKKTKIDVVNDKDEDDMQVDEEEDA